MNALLNTEQVAALTGLASSTLRKMRMKRDAGGLPYCKLGRRCLYREEDVRAFITGSIRFSTRGAA